MKKVVFLLLCCLFSVSLLAGQVDTIKVTSPSMTREIKNVIILPADYDGKTDLPVVYLLHGYSGNHRTWLEINPELPEFATRYGLIIVCPDGKASWYIDSPVSPQSKYETYVTKELVEYIDSHYKTKKEKNGRAITGFSMGGYGAMWLAIHHQDLFGACGATSGGMDIRPFPDRWEIKSVLGDYREHRDEWDNHCIIEQLHLIKPGLSVIFDCGTEDFFHAVNEKLHCEMVYRHIKHDYISRPGIHSNAYWRNSIGAQLLFFSDFFRGKHIYEEQFLYKELEQVPINL